MPWRVSIRHIQQTGSRLAGWSDNFWSQNSELSGVVTATEELRNRLNAITGKETKLPSARISSADSFRNVRLVTYNTTGSVTAAQIADYPSTALLLKLSAPGPYTTRQWIRGIPDDVVQDGGTYNPSGLTGWSAKLNTFLGTLTDSGNLWSIRALNRNTPTTPVTNVALATGIVTAPAHGLGAAGAIVRVRVKGFIVPRGLNKVWKATILTDSTLQLNFYTPPTQVNLAPYAITPTVRLQTYIYVQIAEAVIDRVTSHYTGRPIELLGGRRRTRRRTQGGIPVDA